MRRFARLYAEMDATNRSTEKIDALERYFREAPQEDSAWALRILAGEKVKRAVSSTVLFETAAKETGLPGWLLDECRDAVGDSSETIALLLPEPAAPAELPLREVFERFILPMQRSQRDEAGRILAEAWRTLPADQRLPFHKLISGTFRVGAQRLLLVRALARIAGVEPAVMSHRLSGSLAPTAETVRNALSPEAADDPARPYPFCLAHQLDDPPESLGDVAHWLAEWKWDGVRAQLIRRGDGAWMYSRGEESMDLQFPEVLALARALPPGTVLDGEVLAWQETAAGGRPLPFADLQRRLGRKDVQAGLFDTRSIAYIAFDILEWGGVDIRPRALAERRALLGPLVASLAARGQPIRLSEVVRAASWEELATLRAGARDRSAEGLMLKHEASAYHAGRVRDAAGLGWWKWKLDPFAIDAVLIAAQPGSGKRAGLFTDYTFGVRDGDRIVPIAKAYSGLTDEEIRRVDAFVRRNTTDRAGPVRLVAPEMVFEIGFQQVQESTRHKSGLAVRFPRILCMRPDKTAEQATTLDEVRALLRAHR